MPYWSWAFQLLLIAGYTDIVVPELADEPL
jgi:hypothetical protein